MLALGAMLQPRRLIVTETIGSPPKQADGMRAFGDVSITRRQCPPVQNESDHDPGAKRLCTRECPLKMNSPRVEALSFS